MGWGWDLRICIRFVGLLDPAQVLAFSFVASFIEGHMTQCACMPHSTIKYEQDRTTVSDRVCKKLALCDEFQGSSVK